MVAHRRRDLVKSRGRVEDDEEEAGSETAPLEDDSMSEATALSDLDDEDADADGSDISEQDDTDAKEMPAKAATAPVKAPPAAPADGQARAANGDVAKPPAAASQQQAKLAPLLVRGDTGAMLNGLKMPAESNEAEEIDFDDLKPNGVTPKTSAKADAGKRSEPKRPDLAPERTRRTQEEYRQKRDADPTFVPNRGGFFMHDHRHPGPAANGFRPFGKGRGRGRGAASGPSQGSNPNGHVPEPMSGPWSHDLHESVARDKPSTPQQNGHASAHANGNASHGGTKQPPHNPKTAPPNRSFSRSTHIGNVQIRVFLPGMKDAITFSGVPVKQHTRLPQHRPPLRRDKPVRISLPEAPPRYIFPTVDRSFIFIPRALRPNQQGFGRGGHGGRGGFGPPRGLPASRQTSVYGWSVYSPSVTMSRRSSMAQDSTIGRDHLFQGSASAVSRPPGTIVEPGKPVVRLPPAMDPSRHALQMPEPPRSAAASEPSRPDVDPSLAQPPPMPQLVYQENRPASLPMHQPRPQKAVSVAEIDSPEKVTFPRPPQQHEQPFHQQMPHEVNGNAYGPDGAPKPHSRNASYLSQPSTGTPLSHIPERAIHAQPFQPQSMPVLPPTSYASAYPTATSQPIIYYPSSDPRAAPYAAAPVTTGAPSAPMFIPGQPQAPYALAITPGAAPAPGPAPQQTGPSGTVAQESNGMVYYYDAAQVFGAGAYPPPPPPPPHPHPHPGSFAMAPTGGVVGMGGMMTPTPDGYYYPHASPGAVYYNQ